ncbi:right-handed parallel beta-helix repeat-containing protein [Chthonobacter albigriseus]|uniref:right-handed parallel beta-helix repeat-containing protein n=1 Tax=Chthonobacter albigriseus TaxID=1683161 RepID=UPI0015EED2FA|nr:right-handed parallel beta-helix repeat-containing protein [Chthonobacter albigriseus]
MRYLPLGGLAAVMLAGHPAPAATILVDPTLSQETPASVRSLTAAVDRAREIRKDAPDEPIAIELVSGVHRVDRIISLTRAESGVPGTPFVIRGAADGSTSVLGSVAAPTRPVAEADLAAAPDVAPALLGKALVVDLKDLGLPGDRKLRPRGAYVGTPDSAFELVQNGRRFRPARWPDEGYWSEATATADPDGYRVTVPPEHAAAWARDPNTLLAGYFVSDWAYETVPILPGEPDGDSLRIGRFQAPLDLREDMPFRIAAVNAIAALDQPGEYYLDAAADRAIFLPLDPGAPVEVAVTKSIFAVNGSNNLLIEKLELANTLGDVVAFTGGDDITLRDCGIRNTGSRGVMVEGSRRLTVERCVVADTAETGITVYSGDRPSLGRGDVVIANSAVVRFGQDSPTYRPGVELHGVGNTLRGSYLAHGPHSAVVLGGNDHRVENNEIEDVLRETNDAGAIYMGRDWTMRGNVITGNYLHDIGWGAPEQAFVTGVYFDDQFSGVELTRNVFVRVHRAVVLGGGRDHLIKNNVFLWTRRPAIHFDDRGLNWQKDMTAGGQLRQNLDAMPYATEPWKSRYPELVNILDDELGVPKGNRIIGNAAFGKPLLEFTDPAIRSYLTEEGNIELPADTPPVKSDDDGELVNNVIKLNDTLKGLSLDLAERRRIMQDMIYFKLLD